jgi:hypothetical protein
MLGRIEPPPPHSNRNGDSPRQLAQPATHHIYCRSLIALILALFTSVQETHGRKVLLARTGGRVYATDAACFHMGGNLAEGDIEDVAGHACIVCPLHRYKVRRHSRRSLTKLLVAS